MVPPVLGGLIVGAVNVGLPLTVGDGALVISKIIQYGYYYVGSTPDIPSSVGDCPINIPTPPGGDPMNLLALTCSPRQRLGNSFY